MVQAFGIFLGVPLGGLILSHLSWHWIFFINVAIGIIASFYARKYIPKDNILPLAKENNFEYAGMFLRMSFIASTIFAIDRVTELGFDSPIVIGLFLMGIVFLISFIIKENKAKDAILNLSLFKSKYFVSSNNHLVMSYAPVDRKRVVSATLNTFINMSTIFGVKIFETIYTLFNSSTGNTTHNLNPYNYA